MLNQTEINLNVIFVKANVEQLVQIVKISVVQTAITRSYADQMNGGLLISLVGDISFTSLEGQLQVFPTNLSENFSASFD